jgi:tyrosine-protein phosphatase SIW14
VLRFNTILSRSYLAAFLAVLLLVGTTAQAGNLPGIDNFGKINEKFYRGAQPQGGDYGELAAFGIRTVINLTSHDAEENEKSMVEKAGMKYIQIPMTTHEYPAETKVKKFLDIVNDPANQPIYVHCVGGKHRTGVLTAVYRMTQEGWTADRAYQEMKDYKFGSSFFHPEFKSFVFDYEERIQRENSKPINATVATAGAH